MTTFYTVTGNPISLSRGQSALIRAEFVLIQTGFASVNTDITAKMPLAGGTFTGPVTFNGSATASFAAAATFTSTVNMTGSSSVTAPTQTAGDSSTKVATTAFVAATAFSSALPAQTGNSGKVVTTDGSNASWATPNSLLPVSLSTIGGLTPAADRMAYYTGASTAALATLTTFGRSLIDDADAATGRATLAAANRDATAKKTTTYTAVPGDRIPTGTTGGAWTLTLPLSPSDGTLVEFWDDDGTWQTNNLTVARNGQTIEGLSENLTCNVRYGHVLMAFNGTTWRVR